MSKERTDASSAEGLPGALLGRIDQMTIAVFLAVGLAVMSASVLWRQLDGNGVSDIDHTPQRLVEFRIDINRADWAACASLKSLKLFENAQHRHVIVSECTHSCKSC